METKIVVLGQEPKEKQNLKPIELIECLMDITGNWRKFENIENSNYNFFELNPSYKIRGMKVITARNKANGDYEVWLGHWNDGVV